jgi:hypothetical protein
MIETVISTPQVRTKSTMVRQLNPCLLFQVALEEIDEQFGLLYRRYGVTFKQFCDFIAAEKPSIWRKINKYEKRINNNIYDLYDRGGLLDQIYSDWKRDLSIWKKCFVIALRFYEMKHFGREMVKHQLPN